MTICSRKGFLAGGDGRRRLPVNKVQQNCVLPGTIRGLREMRGSLSSKDRWQSSGGLPCCCFICRLRQENHDYPGGREAWRKIRKDTPAGRVFPDFSFTLIEVCIYLNRNTFSARDKVSSTVLDSSRKIT